MSMQKARMKLETKPGKIRGDSLEGITCDGALDAFYVATISHARLRKSVTHAVLQIFETHKVVLTCGTPGGGAQAWVLPFQRCLPLVRVDVLDNCPLSILL